MLKGLGSLALRALPLLLLATPAWAGSTLYLNSQPGDAVFKGQQATFTDADGIFAISGKTTASGITITFNRSSPAQTWTLGFAAPQGTSLALGNYDNAQRWPFLSPVLPAFSVTNNSVFCNTVTGRFVVRDIAVDGSGNVTTFAADFQQLCQGSTAPLLGAIRYNSSIPYPVDAPTADAGGRQIVAQGATVTVDGSLSESGNGSVTAYTWTQLSGPAVSLTDASAVTTTFTAPTVSTGGADVVLQLEVDNSLSLSSTSTVAIHVANPADPVSVLHMVSATGDYIGQGQIVNLNAAQAQFTATPGNGGQSVSMGVNVGLSNNWGLLFEAPQGQQLQLGTYDGAAASNYAQSSTPGIDVSGEGRACTVTGRFAILDLQKDGNGNITSFAADFEQICNGAVNAPLYGQIRYNSTVPLDAPLVDAGNAQTMVEGETVTLSGSSWSIGGDGNDITSYQWTQLSGSSVTLSDASVASPTFTAPDTPMGGEDLVFQLTVTNSLGLSSTSTVTVHVANPSDAMTMLRMEFSSGGIQPGGRLITVTSAQLPFVPTMGPGGVVMNIGSFGTTSNWRVTLAAPTLPQQPLRVGSYNNALVQLPLNPSMVFYTFLLGDGVFGCTGGGTVTGRFVILAIQTDSSGNLKSLAADFDEYCSSDSTTFHGMLRYNSTVPLDTPEADAGGKQEALPGAALTLPATTSYAGSTGDSIAAYQWMQLSGPPVTLSDATAAAPTFTAPAVNPGGADLIFQLTVTNSNGLTGTDTATVHVFNAADPRMLLHIKSDAGDPVGKGQTFDYSDLNALFAPSVVFDSNTAKLMQVTFSEFPIGPGQWQMEFAPVLNQVLQAGPYDNARNFFTNGQILAQPGLVVSYGGIGGAQSTGRFDILDIQKDQFGNITSLAVDFEQTNNGASSGLHGQLRFNSSVPLNVPYADTGAAQTVDESATVTLGGSDSDAGPDGATISTYQWVQESGPSVTLSDPTGATTTFTSPDVPLGGADLTFQLTVTNSDGVSSTSTVTVHVSNPNDSKTRFYVVSKAGDPVGQGQTFDERTSNAIFSISSQASGNVANNSVTVMANNGGDSAWHFLFSAPSGQSLQAGTHYVISQIFSNSHPSLDAAPFFDSCGVAGLFVVRDLKTDQSGNVTSFAADFQQYCDGNPPMYGWVRYNSTIPMDEPMAAVGPDQYTYSGLLPVTLDGSVSVAGPGDALSYQWEQVVATGDPVVALSDPTDVKPMFLTPAVAPGGRTLVFKLTVTNNGNGLTDSTLSKVTVGNENDVKSAFYYESDPGDPVGQGTNGFGAAPAISVSRGFEGEFAAAFEVGGQALSAALSDWGFSFQAADDKPLRTGIYRVVPGSFILPTMQVSSQASSCTSPTGLFIVRDLAFDNEQRITSIGVDFVQHCDGATGDLRGAFRYNSKTPILINEPTADPGPDQSPTQPGTITLDGSASFPGWGTIISSQWRQVSGPRVTLANANTATTSFSLPKKMFANGGSVLVFNLLVKNSLGMSSTGNVTITAKEPADALLSLQSDAGDPIGGGQFADYGFPNTTVQLQTLGNYGATALLSRDGDWTLDFVAPRKQGLQVGTYSNATLFGRFPGNTPLMDVHTASAQCKTVSGSFTVLDVLYGMGNKIDSLAVDFVQHCNGIGPALHGKFRYHSAVP